MSKSTIRFGESMRPTQTAFQRLLLSLPGLRNAAGTQPFNASELLQWLCTTPRIGHEQQLAARFALTVWNRSADWVKEAASLRLPHPHRARRVELLETVELDSAHRTAIAEWLKEPIFAS